jgi:hypothetical protein
MRALIRIAVPALTAAIASTLALVGPPPAHAAGETFKVLTRNNIGCASGATTLTVERAGLDAGPSYTVHTVVTAGGLVYMNEAASISVNGQSSWGLFNNFTYDPVPNPGTWPIPAGIPMQIDFTLERPKGGPVLFQWKTVLDGCTTGNILYNNLSSLDTDNDLLTTPADQCPGAAAATPNGCPQIARVLKLKYKAKVHRFRGSIDCSVLSLRNEQQVTIYKKRPGPDKKYGRARTDGLGLFALKKTVPAGRYYAVVLATIDPNAGQAGQTTSKTIRLR